MAQQDSEHNSGTFPAEMRNLQSEIGVDHKCKIAPLRAKKILDYKRGVYDIHLFSIYHNSISVLIDVIMLQILYFWSIMCLKNRENRDIIF